MRIPFWTAWRNRETRKAFEEERRHDIWLDAQIDVWQQHEMNEDMVLSGDPPYWPACGAIGDGHVHLIPGSLLPNRLAPTAITAAEEEK